MWYDESVIYQFHLFGFCGAPYVNDGITIPRIRKVNDWIGHLQKLGVDAVYFCPFWECDSHGYDTRDFMKLDCRLGNNSDLLKMTQSLHDAGIRVIFDGVFNHVGRGCPFFKDVLEKRQGSKFKDWFYINFDGNSCYNDGLWYEGWEGHYELVKLNLSNPEVRTYLFDCVGQWIDYFGADGIRLDVAYMLDREFMKALHDYVMAKKSDFFLVGEIIHGDYRQIVNYDMLCSATNYECYKGLYSSFNSMNMFEIGHSLLRQFGPEEWTLYKGMHLLNFADNHDVTRVATILNNKEHIKPLYGLMFGMPGIPCIYYGSEWGAEGAKGNNDWDLRPAFDNPSENELTEFIGKLSEAHKNSRAICYGSLTIPFMTNRQLVLSRTVDEERVLVAVNADGCEFTAHFDTGAASGHNLITGEEENLAEGLKLAPYDVKYIRLNI